MIKLNSGLRFSCVGRWCGPEADVKALRHVPHFVSKVLLLLCRDRKVAQQLKINSAMQYTVVSEIYVTSLEVMVVLSSFKIQSCYEVEIPRSNSSHVRL